MLDKFDPYLSFRFGLFFVSTVYLIYQLWATVIWYRGLPRIARKYIALLLLKGRWDSIGREIVILVFLVLLWGWLTYLNLTRIS